MRSKNIDYWHMDVYFGPRLCELIIEGRKGIALGFGKKSCRVCKIVALDNENLGPIYKAETIKPNNSRVERDLRGPLVYQPTALVEGFLRSHAQLVSETSYKI